MTIWKTVLGIAKREQTIEVPRGAVFLYAKRQGLNICIWYKVPCKNAPKHPCQIVVMRTGQDIDIPMALLNPLGCAMFDDDALVFHIFSVMPGYEK